MNQKLMRALHQVKNGADIYGYSLAKALREIEKKHPEYICISEPMQYQGDGSDQMPYFGAIATVAGKQFLAEHGTIICKKCGCDDDHACVNDFGEPCYWVEIDYKSKTGLCSHCAKSDDDIEEE